MPSLIEIGLLVSEKKILKFFSVFLLFRNYLRLEKGNPLHLNNLESPSPKNDLCQIWLKPSLIEIGLLVLEKKILKKIECIFTLL
jgi:hypothetical protein